MAEDKRILPHCLKRALWIVDTVNQIAKDISERAISSSSPFKRGKHYY
jgi:hypothetical protein